MGSLREKSGKGSLKQSCCAISRSLQSYAECVEVNGEYWHLQNRGSWVHGGESERILPACITIRA